LDLAGNVGWSDDAIVYHDNISPVLGNTSVFVTYNSAKINWSVSEIANNSVNYTHSGNNNSFLTYGNLNAFAEVNLTSLGANTLYFYYVSSCDKFNQCSNSSLLNFTTTFAPSSPSSSGGGGSSNDDSEDDTDFICYEEWICGPWSSCVDGEETKKCFDGNNCGTDDDKPEMSRECELVLEENDDGDTSDDVNVLGNETQENGLGGVTGAFLGINSFTWFGIIGLFLIIIILLIWLYISKRKIKVELD